MAAHPHSHSFPFRWHRLLVTTFVVSIMCGNLALPRAHGQLSPDEQQLLVLLDSDTVTEVVRLVGQLREWREKCLQLKKELETAASAAEALEEARDSGAFVNAVVEIAKTLESVVTKSPELDKYIHYSQRIAPLLNSAEEKYKNAQFSAAQFVDIDEAAFREEIKEIVMAAAAHEVFEVVDSEVIAAVECLKNPAQFAKVFADQEITQWLAKPRQAAGVTFKILKTDPAKSLFSQQADIVIEMQYGPGIVVEAHGLYFKYVNEAPFFEAVLDQDNMKITTNLKSLAKSQLTKVANELLAKIDGPVTVSNFEFTDFGTHKAGLTCDIAVNLGDLLPISATGKAIVTTEQQLEWSGELGMTYHCVPPIPVGSTPLGIHQINGHWTPDAKQSAKPGVRQLSVGTVISTVVSESDNVVSLNVALAFDFPVRAVDMDGTVTFSTTPIGDIWGTIDLDQEIAQTQLRIPGRGSAIPTSVFAMDARTTISREGLESVGNCKLFGKTLDKSRLFLANNGHGTLTIESGKICGVDIAPRLSTGFKPGFSEVWARLVFESKVDVGFAKLLDVAVEVVANSKNKEYPVHVVVNVWGEKISFDLPSLDAVNEAAIVNAVKEHMPELYDAALEAMARGEKSAHDALAIAEKDFKRDVADAVARGGFDAVRTGNKDVDSALGKISDAGKQAGGELAAQREQLGKTLTELRKNPTGAVDSLVNSVSNNATSALSDAGKLLGLGGGGKKPESSGPSREEIERQVRQAKVEQSLEQLRAQLNAVALHRSGQKDDRSSGRDKYANESAVSLSFRNASSELQGNHDAVLALLIGCSDFHSTINTKGTSRVVAGSDAQVATVHLTQLVADKGESHPRAKIDVPNLKHVSECDVRLLALREIQRLVELYVPNVQVEGPRMHFESELCVANHTPEPITVWVQGRFRSVQESKFVWRWAPGAPGSRETYRFQIDPGKTELLEINSRFPSDNATVDTQARPLTANRVRLWVESESGERWMTYRDKDLWLLQPNSAVDETRGYFADQPRVYTHVVEPKSGGRIYNDRILRLTNKTNEPLQVSLSYRASEGGQTTWRQIKEFAIGPGASGYPTTSEGMRVRASQIRFTAKSDNYYYGEYERKPLPLVDVTQGRRLYYAKKIGLCDHAFEMPAGPPAASSK